MSTETAKWQLETLGTLYYLSYTLIKPGFSEIIIAPLTTSSSLESTHISRILNELITDIWVNGEDTQTAQDTLHQHAIYKIATKHQK